MVTVLCGRVLSERALRLLFNNPTKIRARRIGANPEKSDLVNFRGLD